MSGFGWRIGVDHSKASLCFRTVVSYFKEVRLGQTSLTFGGSWKVVLFTNLCYKDNHVLQEPANSIVISVYCLLVSVAGKVMFRFLFGSFLSDCHKHLHFTMAYYKHSWNFIFSFRQPVGDVCCPQEPGDEDCEVWYFNKLNIFEYDTVCSYALCRNIFIFNLALSDLLLVRMTSDKHKLQCDTGLHRACKR